MFLCPPPRRDFSRCAKFVVFSWRSDSHRFLGVRSQRRWENALRRRRLLSRRRRFVLGAATAPRGRAASGDGERGLQRRAGGVRRRRRRTSAWKVADGHGDVLETRPQTSWKKTTGEEVAPRKYPKILNPIISAVVFEASLCVGCFCVASVCESALCQLSDRSCRSCNA